MSLEMNTKKCAIFTFHQQSLPATLASSFFSLTLIVVVCRAQKKKKEIKEKYMGRDYSRNFKLHLHI